MFDELIDNAVYEHDRDLINTYEMAEEHRNHVALPQPASLKFIKELVTETGS